MWPLFPPFVPETAPRALEKIPWAIFGRKIRATLKKVGYASKTRADIEAEAKGHLKALSDFLDNKKYVFGDQMSILDCYVFGILTQLLFVSPASSNIRSAAESFDNLVNYHSRIKDLLYPDWVELVYKKPVTATAQ
jgi:glutathione S-transferase